MIRKEGAAAFSAAIEQSVDFLDFQISHKKATLGSDLRNQVQLIEQTAVTIALNPQRCPRDLMIRSHAHQLGVSEDALRKGEPICGPPAKGAAQAKPRHGAEHT